MKPPLNRMLIGPALSFSVLAATGVALVGLGGSYELRRVSSGVAQAATSLQPATQTPVAIDGSGAQLSNIYVNISEKLMPSVVNIFTTQKVQPRYRSGTGDIWEHFFGGGGAQGFGFGPGGGWAEPQALGRGGRASRGGQSQRMVQQQPPSAPMSLGTGFVIEAESGGGLILTNNHVIEGADEVKVKFTESSDEAEVTAEVLGTDPELDIALLRVRTPDRKLVAVSLGDSDRLKVGEWVAALGNPFGHGHSISHGIVSAKERGLPGGFGKYLQTDAPINPGNSGGPLVNLAGEVVGINNAIDARGPGIGFAIPANSVRSILARLKSGKPVERGYLGIQIMPLKPELARALRTDAAPGAPVVADVMSGTPAAKAGLAPYDVITEIDGRKVKSTEELMQVILEVPVGKIVTARVSRSGKSMSFELPVAARPQPARRT